MRRSRYAPNRLLYSFCSSIRDILVSGECLYANSLVPRGFPELGLPGVCYKFEIILYMARNRLAICVDIGASDIILKTAFCVSSIFVGSFSGFAAVL